MAASQRRRLGSAGRAVASNGLRVAGFSQRHKDHGGVAYGGPVKFATL